MEFKLSRAEVRFILDNFSAEDPGKDDIISIKLHQIWDAASEADVVVRVQRDDEDVDAPEWEPSAADLALQATFGEKGHAA